MASFRILENSERSFRRNDGKWYPNRLKPTRLQAHLWHNFVNCIKHEMKYTFLFMEYVNLTEIINNIRKTKTKRREQKWYLKTWWMKFAKKKIQQQDPNHWCHHWKYNAYNRSATSYLEKHTTKQGIWKAANIFPSINAVFSSISE